jgi:hypothetical protein
MPSAIKSENTFSGMACKYIGEANPDIAGIGVSTYLSQSKLDLVDFPGLKN